MATQIASFLIPKNGQSYFLLEDTYLRGSMRVTLNTTTRDALHPSTKKAGMLVWTQADNKLWQLQSDLTTYTLFNLTSSTTSYTHHQDVLSDTWVVVHNKNCSNFTYNVYKDDISGVIIPSQVLVIDSSTIEILFAYPISGRCTFTFDLS